jgi:hypothetical protein
VCETNRLDPLVGIQLAHIELYIRHLGETGLMPSSVPGFFRFAHIDGLIPADRPVTPADTGPGTAGARNLLAAADMAEEPVEQRSTPGRGAMPQGAALPLGGGAPRLARRTDRRPRRPRHLGARVSNTPVALRGG